MYNKTYWTIVVTSTDKREFTVKVPGKIDAVIIGRQYMMRQNVKRVDIFGEYGEHIDPTEL